MVSRTASITLGVSATGSRKVARTAAIRLGSSAGNSRKITRRAAISLGSFFTSSPYASGGGLAPLVNRRNLRSFLPDRSVPIAEENGTLNQQWWNCFKYVIDEVLAIQDGLSLRDVKAAADYAAIEAIASRSSAAATDQQVRQNAVVLQTLAQVTAVAALPGVEQVPPVQLYKVGFNDARAA